MEDILENFIISNLRRDKNINNKSIKSFILTPYSSLIEDDESKPQLNNLN